MGSNAQHCLSRTERRSAQKYCQICKFGILVPKNDAILVKLTTLPCISSLDINDSKIMLWITVGCFWNAPEDPTGSAMCITKWQNPLREHRLQLSLNRRGFLMLANKLGYLAKGISEPCGRCHQGFLATHSKQERRERNWGSDY